MISKKEKKRTLSRDNSETTTENIMQKKAKLGKSNSVAEKIKLGTKDLKNKKPKAEKGGEKNQVSNLLRVKKEKQTSKPTSNKTTDQPKQKSANVAVKKRPLTMEAVKEKIKLMEDRELTKSGRKRLAFLKRKLRFIEQGGNPDQEPSMKSRTPTQSKVMKNKTLPKIKREVKKQKMEESLISSDSIEEEPKEDDSESEDEDMPVDNDEADTSKDEGSDDVEKDDSDDEDDEEEDDKNTNGNDDNSDDDEEETNTVANSKTIPTKQTSNDDSKKKRYVLFVGNLPFTIKEDQLKRHFLSKVDKIKDVRIPKKPNSEQSRGFAYVELFDQTNYEKALSLHETFMEGRKINVQYSSPGAKFAANKNQVIAKNKKLQEMRKTGKLAGSRVNKRGISQKYQK